MVTTVTMVMVSLVKGDLTEWTEKGHHPTSAPVPVQHLLSSKRKVTSLELLAPSQAHPMTYHLGPSHLPHQEDPLYQDLILATQA